MKYIIEICIAIDIAILSIAYPLLADKISNIGEKFKSQFLKEVFKNEFPQKKYPFTFGTPLFKFVLFSTLISFFFMIFEFPPLFSWNNIIINNSAKLIVLISTVILVFLFFEWISKVALFNGNSISLLKHLIKKINSSKDENEYILKSINELAYYSITFNDEHLQETLLEFYHNLFKKIRNQQSNTSEIIYPIDLNFLIRKLCETSTENSTKLKALEHRAVSGLWLLGEDWICNIFSDKKLSHLLII
ncbi:hypothetical protein [Flammeovirga aprica]|uniref:Uncharacterized protein n=1 Tax=Flammeovirga aprica JL-4 TaxID=694437 RepID=A0A7X9S291_9BACT|nr:hypothetical protein [Flammeovirga aprica]NME73037.1 hypothetical protein [Flammeovirga aprica JL-4]